MELHSVRFVQGEPDCYPFKDYKCPCTGEPKKVVFICDIPLEERHKYIDPSQDINDSRMRVMGHCKNDLDCCNEKQVDNSVVKEQAEQIRMLSNHLTEMTLQINKLTEKLFSQDKSNGK
jgi:hypothetical protein